MYLVFKFPIILILKFRIVFSLDRPNIGTWIKVVNEWNKWVKVVKRRGQKEHSKQDDEQNKFIHYNKTNIDTSKIVVCVCVCVCN